MKVKLFFCLLLASKLVLCQNINGTWALDLPLSKDTSLIEQICFSKNRRLEITYQGELISGKYKKKLFKRNHIIIKVCIPHLENRFKCSSHSWRWIIYFKNNNLHISETDYYWNEKNKLVYIKTD